MVMVIDGVAMKHKNLFNKNMLLILIPLIVISITVVGVSKNIIENYFRNDSFKILTRELALYDTTAERAIAVRERLPQAGQPKPLVNTDLGIVFKPNKSVQTAYLIESKKGILKVISNDDTFVNIELEGLKDNTEWPFQSETVISDENIFYAVVPVKDPRILEKMNAPSDTKIFMLAYISDKYSIELTQSVMTVFISGMSVISILILIILFFIFRKISRRLKMLEDGTSSVGKGNFQTIIPSEPSDEIGRLGDAMNRMSKQLHLIQEEQAEQFQMISHELKTPIMVMQGYLDAMQHDQYPNGSKEETMRILIQELERLENLTKDILTISKVDYLSRNNVELKTLHLSELFKQVTELLSRDEGMDITITGEHTVIGDQESWHRIIENIISNNLRYAKSRIDVNLGEFISIRNDGEPIEIHLLSKIKSPFVKGNKGRSGLGLTIVSNTLKLYEYGLEIKNINGGVEYIITKET